MIINGGLVEMGKSFKIFSLLILICLASLRPGMTFAACNPTIDPTRELLITDLSVVNNARANGANGVWSFGYLIRQMTPAGVDASDFAANWIFEIARRTSVNGFPVPPRPQVQKILAGWPKLENGKLNLDLAPFRLLAIVNRLDVSATGSAGEGRFVYGLYDPLTGEPLQFTTIFEYHLSLPSSAGSGGKTAPQWAQSWHDLGTTPFGEDFNRKLEGVTAQFVRRGANGKSALSQVRTNEVFLGRPWEMREFSLDSRGILVESTTAQTPAYLFNDPGFPQYSQFLQWIRANREAIQSGTHVVPPQILGGAVPMPMVWAAPLNLESPDMKKTRHFFAQQTCNGCHSVETATEFTHLESRAEATPSRASRFLTGDLIGRAKNLQALLCASRGLRGGQIRYSSRVH